MTEAVRWYRKAAEQGYERAKPLLENLERSVCFVTSAVTVASGRSDDCTELQTLRRFRDAYMAATPERRAEVQHYYQVAPQIVERIAARPDARRIWLRLASEYIYPAVALVQAGRDEEAHALYRAMVDRLVRRFAPELGAGKPHAGKSPHGGQS